MAAAHNSFAPQMEFADLTDDAISAICAKLDVPDLLRMIAIQNARIRDLVLDEFFQRVENPIVARKVNLRELSDLLSTWLQDAILPVLERFGSIELQILFDSSQDAALFISQICTLLAPQLPSQMRFLSLLGEERVRRYIVNADWLPSILTEAFPSCQSRNAFISFLGLEAISASIERGGYFYLLHLLRLFPIQDRAAFLYGLTPSAYQRGLTKTFFDVLELLPLSERRRALELFGQESVRVVIQHGKPSADMRGIPTMATAVLDMLEQLDPTDRIWLIDYIGMDCIRRALTGPSNLLKAAKSLPEECRLAFLQRWPADVAYEFLMRQKAIYNMFCRMLSILSSSQQRVCLGWLGYKAVQNLLAAVPEDRDADKAFGFLESCLSALTTENKTFFLSEFLNKFSDTVLYRIMLGKLSFSQALERIDCYKKEEFYPLLLVATTRAYRARQYDKLTATSGCLFFRTATKLQVREDRYAIKIDAAADLERLLRGEIDDETFVKVQKKVLGTSSTLNKIYRRMR